uniref:hypothetical protein n=1 Tax=Lachnospira sp. TaxID=2049031 RepID=UPI003FEE0C78
MNNKQDKELVQLIQDVVDGKVQKKELCNKIYKEVYALSYPVYKDEAKSTTQAKKALIQVCSKINGIDLTKNIHKQIAVIVSTYFFVNAVDENSKELSEKTDIKEYKFSKIREDEEFLMYMKKKANAFRSPLVFDEEDEKLKSLDSVQMALVELYAYEMQSVDAIERMTDVDSSYIGSWIAQIKFILSGEAVALENTADEAKAAVANDNISDEIYEDAYENSDDDKEQYDESDDESEEYSNEYDEQEAVSSVYQKRNRQHENAVTLFIRRLFPALSLPARMAMSWIAGCIVVIALVSVLFVSVIAGKNNKKKVNKDYDYRDMQYYTTKQPTTKQTGTTAGSTTAGQTEEGNTTENNTAQTERRENTREETQRETTRNNEESREQQEESSVEEQPTEEPTEEQTEQQTTEEQTEQQTEKTTEQQTTEEQTTEEKTTAEEKTTSDSDDDKQDRPISNENSDNN